MTPHIALLLPPIGARDGSRGDAPVLIRVPMLSVGPRRAARPSIQPRRSRRRLRREIRVAASALMFALPMSWALLAFAKIGPETAPASPTTNPAASPVATPEAPAADPGPRATITLDPSAVAYPSAPALDVPAVVPAGYLVPDDGSEESLHEGD